MVKLVGASIHLSAYVSSREEFHGLSNFVFSSREKKGLKRYIKNKRVRADKLGPQISTLRNLIHKG